MCIAFCKPNDRDDNETDMLALGVVVPWGWVAYAFIYVVSCDAFLLLTAHCF